MKTISMLVAGIIAGTAFSAAAAVAQDYPTQPVTIVVPFSAGGPTDTVTRLVAAAMSEDLGQQVVVQNVGGAGGTLGAGQVAANRKKFRGQLERTDAGWQLVWSDEPAAKPGQRVSRRREPAPLQAIGFTLDELKEARLAPVVDFKGRRPRQTGEP